MPFEQDVVLALSIGGIIGVLLGFIIAGSMLWRRLSNANTKLVQLETRVKHQDDVDVERDSALELAAQRLSLAFDELASRSLRHNSETFLKLAKENLGTHHERARGDMSERERAVAQLIEPIQLALQKTEQKLAEIEKERHQAYGNIKTQLESMSKSQSDLRTETQNLVRALSKPDVRGQWGEFTLRRVVELAGMVKHCDFLEQVQVTRDGVVQRPDMVIRMPEHRDLVVDAKTPLDAYLDAMDATTESDRLDALAKHTRNLKERIKELSSKQYWSQFESSPEFVILFIPGEQYLAAALDHSPALQEEAMQQKILLATPTSLVGLLKVVAYGWRQLSLTKNAEKIRELGEDLYTRLASFSGHLARLGKQLASGVDSYNAAVGSLERQVLPGAKKFRDMGVSSRKTIDEVPPVDTPIRSVSETVSEDS